MSSPAPRRPRPAEDSRSRTIVDTVTRLVEERRRARHWAQEVVDWSEADCAVYDPVRDRYVIQLPGDLLRRLRSLNT